MYQDDKRLNPSNPYLSFIVSASAGSGKTYQLAHRFLNLVISGADPGSIITITFTKTASKEMRQRICRLAFETLGSSTIKKEIINDFLSFNKNSKIDTKSIDEACKKILSLEQNLRLSTIDSLFYEWIKMFPYESGLFKKDYYFNIPDSSHDFKILQEKAWALTLKDLDMLSDKEFLSRYPLSFNIRKKEGTSFLKTRVEALLEHEFFITRYLNQKQGFSDSNLKFLDTGDPYMDGLGKELFSIYLIYSFHLTELKQKNKLLSFSDIAKGVYSIFSNDEYLSSRYLIHSGTHHLLIDEFQDTNRVCWEIFKSISEDLLTDTDSCLPKTVFFVGDEKQSIYSFREADPSIMQEARVVLKDYGVNFVSLDYNYRTSRTLTSYINNFFSSSLPRFNPHIPACDSTGSDFIPDFASITVSDPIEDKSLKYSALREQEAYLIGSYIKQMCSSYKKQSHSEKSPSLVEFKDISILYRQSTDIDIYLNVFKKLNIPYKLDRASDFFSYKEVDDFIALLKSVAFSDRLSLLQVFLSPIISMNESDINSWLNDLIQVGIDQKELKLQDLISQQLIEKYPDIKIILEYSRLFSTIGAYKISYSLFKDLSILEKYQQSTKDNPITIKLNLLKLLDLIYSYEQEGSSSLVSILYILENLSGDEVASYHNDSNAVSFQSIHKSKGLEYPVVILMDTASSWLKPIQYWASYTDSKFNSCLSYVGSSKEREKLDSSSFTTYIATATNYLQDENLRLLYVAMTRASHHLFISGQTKNLKDDSIYHSFLNSIKSFNPNRINLKLDQTYPEAPVSSYKLYSINSDLMNQTITKNDTDLLSSKQSGFIDESFNMIELDAGSKLENLKTLSLKRVGQIHEYSVHKIMDEGSFGDSSILYQPDEEDQNIFGNLTKSSSHHKNAINYGSSLHRYLDHYIKTSDTKRYDGFCIGVGKNQCSLIYKEFINIINSSIFLDLIKDATLYSEYRICALKDHRLVHGIVDLLVIKKDLSSVSIVDYKTGDLSTKYEIQLREYQSIIQKMYPRSKVNSYIFKTSTPELIQINSLN